MPVKMIKKFKKSAQRAGVPSGIRSNEMPSVYGSLPGARGLSRMVDIAARQGMRVRRVEYDTLYSCFLMPAATPIGPRDIFITALGQQGQGFGAAALTTLETNLENGGRIPDEYGYVIYAIGVAIDPFAHLTQPQAVAEVINRTVLSYSFLEREKILGPLWMFPAGGGVSGVAIDMAAAATNGLACNGTPGFNNMATLAEPIVFPNGATFKFTLNTTGAGGALLTNTAAYRLWVRLHGLRTSFER